LKSLKIARRCRNLEARQEARFHTRLPEATLHYRLEMGINSQKGAPFKRVEKRTIKGNLIDT
jgi:hypothetical protein